MKGWQLRVTTSCVAFSYALKHAVMLCCIWCTLNGKMRCMSTRTAGPLLPGPLPHTGLAWSAVHAFFFLSNSTSIAFCGTVFNLNFFSLDQDLLTRSYCLVCTCTYRMAGFIQREKISLNLDPVCKFYMYITNTACTA